MATVEQFKAASQRVNATNVAALVTAATAKTALVDADVLPITDSAASHGMKKATLTSLWTWITTKLGALTSLTAGGAWSFSSTTRPTSAGTGTPASNSLLLRSDGDNRYGGPIEIDVLATNQTVTNSTTLVDATGLSVSMDANSDYEMEVLLYYTMTAAAGLKSAITYSVDGSAGIVEEFIGALGGTPARTLHLTGTVVIRQESNGSSTNWIHSARGVVRATSSRTVKIQFSNYVAAGSTILYAGSYIKIRKLN